MYVLLIGISKMGDSSPGTKHMVLLFVVCGKCQHHLNLMTYFYDSMVKKVLDGPIFFDSAANGYKMGHELAVHHCLHRMARITFLGWP